MPTQAVTRPLAVLVTLTQSRLSMSLMPTQYRRIRSATTSTLRPAKGASASVSTFPRMSGRSDDGLLRVTQQWGYVSHQYCRETGRAEVIRSHRLPTPLMCTEQWPTRLKQSRDVANLFCLQLFSCRLTPLLTLLRTQHTETLSNLQQGNRLI
jgi:hypothetical protein